jgi:hypothetical protein
MTNVHSGEDGKALFARVCFLVIALDSFLLYVLSLSCGRLQEEHCSVVNDSLKAYLVLGTVLPSGVKSLPQEGPAVFIFSKASSKICSLSTGPQNLS